MKVDFTEMVAHELTSPIAAIRALAGMLATGRLDDESQARIVTAIQTETASLDVLVADVRTAAQVERQEFSVDPHPLPVDILLHDAAMFAKALPGQHQVSVDTTVSIPVVADRERIGQVLRNLLSNAVKYSPDGTPIEVGVIANGTCVRIEVTDHGRGIHPDDLSRIFQKYGRGRDETNQRLPGVGLGLYLSQRIVRAHGSELSVQSVPGEGSVFVFELEMADDPRAGR
jgi:signal transduction histidine kinase